MTINRSIASGNGEVGFYVRSEFTVRTAELSCEECVSTNNGWGLRAEVFGGVATMRASHSTATNNSNYGFSLSGSGVFKSLGNNTVRGNGTDTFGSITVIAAK